LKVRIYYNPFKGVFVAKKEDGTVVKVDSDFGVVDTAAYSETSNVEYDLNSFPEMVRNKILGWVEEKESKEGFKSTFMRLVFSYKDVVPPDRITHSLAKKLVRKGLEILKVLTVEERVYVIAKRTTEVFVYEIRNVTGCGWKYGVVKDEHTLPKEVLEYLRVVRDEMREAKVQGV